MGFHGYELAYMRSRVDSSMNIRQTDVVQKEFNVWAVIINSNFKEVPMNRIIKSKSIIINHANPEYGTIFKFWTDCALLLTDSWI
jgi:hypothetical protein